MAGVGTGANAVVCTAMDACHEAGTCDPATGACSNPAKVLDDGNPCTVDSCDPASGVIHTPAPSGTSCSDGNPCNGLETCDGAGACTVTSALLLSGGDPCTLDACAPVLGVRHTLVAALDPGVASQLYPATAFLYEGPDGIQAGVAPGTIHPQRAGAIRGKVASVCPKSVRFGWA